MKVTQFYAILNAARHGDPAALERLPGALFAYELTGDHDHSVLDGLAHE